MYIHTYMEKHNYNVAYKWRDNMRYVYGKCYEYCPLQAHTCTYKMCLYIWWWHVIWSTCARDVWVLIIDGRRNGCSWSLSQGQKSSIRHRSAKEKRGDETVRVVRDLLVNHMFFQWSVLKDVLRFSRKVRRWTPWVTIWSSATIWPSSTIYAGWSMLQPLWSSFQPWDSSSPITDR